MKSFSRRKGAFPSPQKYPSHNLGDWGESVFRRPISLSSHNSDNLSLFSGSTSVLSLDILQGRVRGQWQKAPTLEPLGKACCPWYKDSGRICLSPCSKGRRQCLSWALSLRHHPCCAKDLDPFIPKQEFLHSPNSPAHLLKLEYPGSPADLLRFPASGLACLTLSW